MTRSIVRVLCGGITAALLLLVVGCRSEHQAGSAQAVRDVRETRRQGGFAGEGGLQRLDALDAPPVDQNPSADWNAGYRRGFRDEVRK